MCNQEYTMWEIEKESRNEIQKEKQRLEARRKQQSIRKQLYDEISK